LAAIIRLNGTLNREALEQSLQAIVDRHEILRTRFLVGAHQQPIQVIDAVPMLELPLTDFSKIPLEERETAAHQWIVEFARSPFNLTQGSLLRSQLLRLTDTEHWLVVAAHHLIFDGWSLPIWLRELTDHYSALTTNQVLLSQPLSVQYADFALWHRQQSVSLEAQLAYWKQQLAGALPFPRLYTNPY
jgi:NRPS condensation-like uncharacterized protein